MKFLLDTHAFLWFTLNDVNLSQTALALIAEPTHSILISPASYWEIAIKISLGKYQIPGSFQAWMEQQLRINAFEILPIMITHTATVSSS